MNKMEKKAGDSILPKVTEIDGIFFLSKNPNSIKEWYSKNLEPLCCVMKVDI